MPTIAEVLVRRFLSEDMVAATDTVSSSVRAVAVWLEEHREALLLVLASVAVSLDELGTHKLASFIQLDQRLVRSLMEQGWYPDTRMAPASLALLLSYRDSEPDAIDLIMQEVFRERLDNIEAHLMGEYPLRAEILRDAFWAHRESRYNLSVPALLTQADGIWLDRINRNLFHGGTEGAVSSVVTRISDTNIQVLTQALGPDLPIGLSKTSRQDSFNDLNRHQVLHGEVTDYGTEKNSLKAVSFLNFCAFVLSEAEVPA